MKWIAVALLLVGIWFMARPLARLDFPRYSQLPEYYWAGDYKPPNECSEAVAYLKVRVHFADAKCIYARRYEVWWLSIQNFMRVQLPQLVSLL